MNDVPRKIQKILLIKKQTTMAGRPTPLVVLAGWLGCQPKNLRRYEELYRTNGFRSLLRIAPPHCVVRQVFSPPLEPIVVPNEWPKRISAMGEDGDDVHRTMQAIAWEVLREVHNDGCTSFYFHAFSNGGCFVWEQLRRILLEAPHEVAATAQQQESIGDILNSLRNKLCGVIFDSCPVVYMNRLHVALSHCSDEEREIVWKYHGAELDRFIKGDDDAIQNVVRRRIDAYDAGLRNDPLRIPQLYLYSRDDPLAPAAYIDTLVSHRRNLVQKKHYVMSHVWDESTHCGHLMRHPLEYTAAVRALLQLGKQKELPLAKL